MVGLILQQCIALFVLKTSVGFSIFNWISALASDFLSHSLVGAKFFFDADVISKGWIFVNVVSIISVNPILGPDSICCLVCHNNILYGLRADVLLCESPTCHPMHIFRLSRSHFS